MVVGSILLLLSSLGCGSAPKAGVDDITLSGNAAPDLFTGTWDGTETGTQGGVTFSAQVSLILTQVGSNVTGAWQTGTGAFGTCAGTVRGPTIIGLQIYQNNSGCNGSSGGDVTLSSSVLSGNIQGNYSCGGYLTAAISLRKR